MPPKVKITKEDIVNAAVALVRQRGPQALNARELASRLRCSTQPIFSNFASMEQLRLSVMEERTESIENAPPMSATTRMTTINSARSRSNMFRNMVLSFQLQLGLYSNL